MKISVTLSMGRALATLGACAALCIGCSGGSSDSPAAATPSPQSNVAFRQLSDLNSLNGPAQPATAVVRNTTDWAQLWSAGEVAPAPPAIDFTHEYVLVVALGTKPDMSWGVSVVSVVDSGASIQVTAQQTHCAGNAGQAIQQPATAVAVPATIKPFAFLMTGPVC